MRDVLSLKVPRVWQAILARSNLLLSPWAPQLERRLLPHPSRWHLNRRRPRHTTHASHREDPDLLRRPRGNARRARWCAPMSRLRWSCRPNGTRARHGTRWPLSWVVGLKNRRPKQSGPVCVPRSLAYCPRSQHAYRPPPRRSDQARWPYLRIRSMACATPGRWLVIDHALPSLWAAIRVCLLWRRRARTATPAHGCTSRGKIRSRVTGWCCSIVQLGSGAPICNICCLRGELSFPWTAEASREWWLDRPQFRWKNRLEPLCVHGTRRDRGLR
jgi:hypothetical protein